MKKLIMNPIAGAVLAATLAVPTLAVADAYIQCPGDGAIPDAVPDPLAGDFDPNVICKSLTGGDGFVNMGDGRLQYTFGFADLTGTDESDILADGIFRANFAAPTLVQRQGQKFYLSLTNVGTHNRPDLFDPHTVHYHGFPEASDIFDGLPDVTISINQGATLTYFYDVREPGTYMFHCHVEATEHMQMGMLGNLYVEPGQNVRATGAVPGHVNNGDVDEPPYGNWPTPADGDVDGNSNGVFDEDPGLTKYVYNDDDGSTAYDVEVPIQIGLFDPVFHDASQNTQPLPFADMKGTYPMLNGRGYPDTVQGSGYFATNPGDAQAENGNVNSQPVSAAVEAIEGDKILLRISNLNITDHFTLSTSGLTMKVVGTGARILHGGGEVSGADLSFDTNAVTLGGGEAVDVIIDTTGVTAGTYFLYTSNFNYLSNNTQDYGGMMTEIVINDSI